MVKKDFINRKVSLIQDDLVKLAKLEEFSIEELSKDYLKSAALERILERIINRAIDINQHICAELEKEEPPRDYRDTFLKLSSLKIYPDKFAIEISKSVATRNILVHDYDKVDYALVHSSIKDCIKDYTKYIDYILRFLKKK
ncbi:hypothetical protein COY62_02465 [bacterium (Candidatus Howlettbacteria) CG_4_10_14_0_8_um_filter_40_9]|nr:MAG: hypothetical protein COY62_02465 [bacterium (Candidatus Howlettbacteria) CG_4_10_14_0_8_um_filter_40_9]